ncbi:MAG: hypothetical protein COZ05_11340 [Armatimonadetes bacterium CG_4_10_14_3_um_filter_59_10]|nr:MAG: hypothetical protein COZ05_11340 [Armatimonadetes bacterium CG_4_10_14_3_um_filter_59_10]
MSLGLRGALRVGLRTDTGCLEFEVGYVGCCGRGRRFTPILDALGLKEQTGHNESLEAMVSEVVAKTSFQRGINILGYCFR